MNDTDKMLYSIDELRKYVRDAKEGLPEELFLFATEITPMVNVDLLIRNDKKEILLAWRKDRFYEEGWHVPGGIVRLKESFEERIRKVGEQEIGCSNIFFEPTPLEVVPIICPEMKQRGHFITFVFACTLPKEFVICNEVQECEAGYLKWFRRCPDNLLHVHDFYKKYWR